MSEPWVSTSWSPFITLMVFDVNSTQKPGGGAWAESVAWRVYLPYGKAGPALTVVAVAWVCAIRGTAPRSEAAARRARISFERDKGRLLFRGCRPYGSPPKLCHVAHLQVPLPPPPTPTRYVAV